MGQPLREFEASAPGGRARERAATEDRQKTAGDLLARVIRFAPPLVASDQDIAGLVAAVTQIITGA